tara:strand:- start:4198 stop:4785 length:588 start_codon:yes stop_codon:yes gene_type:complete
MDTQLIHKKGDREVFDDGKFVIKKTRPNAFDFETYKRFQEQNPCFIKVHEYDQQPDHGIIVMDKINGVSHQSWRQRATVDQLWYIAVTFRHEVWKAFYDFMEYEIVDPSQRVFFHADFVPGNLLMTDENKPIIVDPDGCSWYGWDMFLQKLQEHNMVWWNDYNISAHRDPFIRGLPRLSYLLADPMRPDRRNKYY